MLKYSKQRESIKAFLAARTDHPTADTVYLNLRQTIPNISLGTVYRNLSLLVSMGDIVKISCADNIDRFDANTSPHYHCMCNCCGSVHDLPMEVMTDLNTHAEEYFNGIINQHQIMFYGTCNECLSSNQKFDRTNSAVH